LRDIAPRSAASSPLTGRRIAAGIAVFAVMTALAFVSSGPAEAATAPPTIASAFTPTEIGVGDSTATALSFTITNPNASGTLSAVSFTDSLPAGLTIDNPNGENGTCGSAGVISAAPGSSTISLAGGSVKAAASCTISIAVIASQAGVFQNSTSPVSSSAGTSSAGDTKSLTVLPPPTVTVANIKNNSKHTFGQAIKPTYSCAQPADPTALADCSAQDDLGNTIPSGGALKTKVPGDHTLTVTATSSDGLSTTDTFNYTVLPDNRFTVSTVQAKGGGAVSFQLGLPGAGAIKVLELGPKNVTFGKYTATIGQKRTLKVTVKPTPAGRRLLTPRVSNKTTPTRVKVKLTVTYTPKGGVKKTVTKHFIALSST
jgi:hypothetical protein